MGFKEEFDGSEQSAFTRHSEIHLIKEQEGIKDIYFLTLCYVCRGQKPIALYRNCPSYWVPELVKCAFFWCMLLEKCYKVLCNDARPRLQVGWRLATCRWTVDGALEQVDVCCIQTPFLGLSHLHGSTWICSSDIAPAGKRSVLICCGYWGLPRSNIPLHLGDFQQSKNLPWATVEAVSAMLHCHVSI